MNIDKFNHRDIVKALGVDELQLFLTMEKGILKSGGIEGYLNKELEMMCKLEEVYGSMASFGVKLEEMDQESKEQQVLSRIYAMLEVFVEHEEFIKADYWQKELKKFKDEEV